MKSPKWALAAAALCLSALCWAQKPDWQNKLTSLNQSLNEAMTQYYKPLEDAKTDEERAKINLDPAKNPAKAFVPKFKALAKEAGTGNDALPVWTTLAQVQEQAGDMEGAADTVDAIFDHYENSSKLAPMVDMLGSIAQMLPEKERDAKLAAWGAKLEKSKSAEVRAAALYGEGESANRYGMGDAAKARPFFEKVVAQYPNTSFAKRAQGDLFEMDHLAVGKTAPDFDATDQDGVHFKLSDYRGKVVVLDFWGFW